MVTTRKTSDSKVIAMDEKTGGAAAPPRTLLDEVNSQLMCVLCRGYYIDATTIVECLHSFCRSCIVKHLQVKSYCPICEMMINSAKPNIKPDKALQDIVYKLVPGLFQREMQRRQAFYASRPGQAASATPEQRGEDTERIIFSPEDVISFSLEYMDCSDLESASSRSSESGNESTPNEAGAPTRRYLQCPAVVNISHLKKFLSMKYDVDVSNFFVNILYKRVPLPDYYTLMDIAYIYNWKRNEPMRFFYQISDFGAIRDRFGFFGLKRPGTLGRKDEPSPSSPAPSQLTEASDASSGTFSPVPDDKAQAEFPHQKDGQGKSSRESKILEDTESQDGERTSSQSSSSVDVEKSEFLNSFELTAKCDPGSGKCSGSPSKDIDNSDPKINTVSLKAVSPKKVLNDKSTVNTKTESEKSPGKRKSSAPDQPIDGKKIKLTPEKKVSDNIAVKAPNLPTLPVKVLPAAIPTLSLPRITTSSPAAKPVQTTATKTTATKTAASPIPPVSVTSANKSDIKFSKPAVKTAAITNTCNLIPKKPLPMKSSPIKRKLSDDILQGQPSSLTPKAANISKPDLSKTETPQNVKITDIKQRPTPNLTDNIPSTGLLPNPKVNILSRIPTKPDCIPKQPEVKKETKNLTVAGPRAPIKMPNTNVPKSQGDPLKSLFYSCNINIPSSLSITLTDQKEQKTSNELPNENESKIQSQGSSTPVSSSQVQSNSLQKSANSEVHNYIEILKLPDTDAPVKVSEEKNNKSVPSTKPSETPTSGGKGPVPNLKPISDSKQSKTLPISKPQTFQQTFLQSLQQQSEKPKYIKTRLDFPKTSSATAVKVPAEEVPTSVPEATTNPTPSITKPSNVPVAKYKPVPMAQPIRKPNLSPQLKVAKSDSALDLSTPHIVNSQLGLQQAKALETMQSINNLAKRQSYTQRMTSPSQVFSQESFKMNSVTASPIRIPVPPPHTKHLKSSSSSQNPAASSPKHLPEYFQPSKSINNSRISNNGSPVHVPKSLSSQQISAPYTSGSQRSQTRSPSSSPKLVIACPSPKSQSPEDNYILSPRGIEASSQSNLISSSQISSTNNTSKEAASAKETLKVLKLPKAPGPSKTVPPPARSNKSSEPSMSDQLLAQQAYLRQQLELQTQLGLLPQGAAVQWFNNPVARAHFEKIMKNMTPNSQMSFSNYHNVKDNSK